MYSVVQLQELFLDYLDKEHFDKKPNELYEPMNYILNLGGKRLRPVLLLMTCDLFNYSVNKALPVALSIEIFHNFSLVHDDIMDEAPLRRGKGTVHSKYGLNTGILSGDVLLVYAYHYLLEVENKSKIPDLVRLFNKVAIDVCEGQQYDMNFEETLDVTLDEYLNMISLKTAALIEGAMKLGALISGASFQDIKYIAEFGKNVGIAFQLQDDILDTFGDPRKFGKKIGGDIIQNKKTYLLIKAMELAQPSERKKIIDLMSIPYTNEKTKIDAMSTIYKKLNVKIFAEQAKEYFQEKAFEALNNLNIKEERKKPLIKLANSMLARDL